MSAVQPPPALRARVMAAVRAEPVAPRAAGVRQRVLLVLVALLFAGALSIAIGRPGLRGRPFAYVASLAVAWLLVCAVATWAGVGRGQSMLGRSAGWRAGAVALVPMALLATSLGLGAAWPETLADNAGAGAHLLCVIGTMGFALAPLVAFALMRRASDPVAPGLTGAAIATAAGAWGALGIELHCRYTSPFHVVVSHVLPVAILALVGALVASKYVAIRAQTR
jgi:hypothetical protein